VCARGKKKATGACEKAGEEVANTPPKWPCAQTSPVAASPFSNKANAGRTLCVSVCGVCLAVVCVVCGV